MTFSKLSLRKECPEITMVFPKIPPPLSSIEHFQSNRQEYTQMTVKTSLNLLQTKYVSFLQQD